MKKPSIFFVSVALLLLTSFNVFSNTFDSDPFPEEPHATIKGPDVEIEVFPGIYDGTLVDTPEVLMVRCLRCPTCPCAIIVKGAVIDVTIDPGGEDIELSDIKGYSSNEDAEGNSTLTINK